MEKQEKQLNYWKQKLTGANPLLELPTDYPRPPVQTYRGGSQSLQLSASLTASIHQLAHQQGVTLYMTLLAAFATLLFRYSHQQDILIGSPIPSRNRREIDSLISFFVNTLVLRTDLSANPSFEQLLQRVRIVALEAYSHQDLPFSKLVEKLNPQRSLSYHPLFQVLLVVDHPLELENKLSDLTTTAVEVETAISQFDLVLSVHKKEGLLLTKWQYNRDLFEGATITRMSQNFEILLESIVTNPQQSIATLPLLNTAQQQLLQQWNQTQKDYPKSCFHQLFEQQVELTPEAISLVFEGEQLTYRQLNNRANQLAHYLQKLGVQPEVLVGLCVERSLEMIVAVLAILKAGGAYLPLDPNYPQSRLSFILEDAQVSLLLSQEKLLSKLPPTSAKIISIEANSQLIVAETQDNPVSGVNTTNLAYVIYTSGSTGQPKGVLVSHQGLGNLALVQIEQFHLNSNSRILQFASLSFDASVFEIVMALSSGASLCLATQESLLPGPDLLERLRQDRITHVTLPPSALAAMAVEKLPDLKVMVVAGEATSVELAQQWSDGISFFNAYGPTESTVCATMAPYVRGSGKLPIGRPIANTQVYLLDEYLQEVPLGVPGELYIASVGLARGYLHREQLTAQRFIANPFSSEPTARLYKTGDLGRYLADGSIEYLGRIDHQVKIRGFRIELGEIEAVLTQHQAVEQAVVIAREDNPGDKRLVAYVVSNSQTVPTNRELHRFLGDKLPNYMVPHALIILEVFPLTPNGKVDRLALPAPDSYSFIFSNNYVAPSNPTEEALVAIWSQLLGLEKIGIDDNFFELGGHSLLAAQVISRSQQALGVEIPPQSLFENPTVATLAEAIAQFQNKGADLSAYQAIPPRENREPAPLSFSQQQLWFFDQLEPHNSFYNIPWAVRLRGNLNVAVLQTTLDTIVIRHEILRTTVIVNNGNPIQVINAPTSVELQIIDLQQYGETEQETQVQQWLLQESQRCFNLESDQMLRACLLQLAPQEHILLLVMHHIASDGWSMGILWQEFGELYQAYLNGKPSPLPTLPIQYSDFAVWQKQWLSQEKQEKQLNYWKQKLAGANPLLELPTDYPRPPVQTYRGGSQSLQLSASLSTSLHQLAHRQGVTLYMTLLATFTTLLFRYSHQQDILIGSPIAGRHRKEIDSLIGFFVNTLVLRTDLSANPSFEQLLQRVRKVALEAYSHQDLPFSKLVEKLNPKRSLSYHPLFQVMFVLDNPLDLESKLLNLTVTPVEVETATAQFDLVLSVKQKEGLLLTTWQYNRDLFEPATITRMSRNFETLLSSIVSNPQQSIATLPLLTTAQRQQLVEQWNNTYTEYPQNKCIHQLFEQQVELTPEAIALVFEDKQLTYKQLNNRANQLAHYLQQLGVKPDVLVGICAERSLEMIVGILAILKAGGAYVPLDSQYPQERLALMLSDSKVSVLLTQEKLLIKLPKHPAEVVCLDTYWQNINQGHEDNPISATKVDNLAYICYTSGSTGKPKGVSVPHRGVVRLVKETNYIDFSSKEVFLQLAPISFDASTFEIWGSLLNGAKLVIMPVKTPSLEALGQVIRRYQVSTLWLTAGLFHLMVDEQIQDLKPVRQLLAGGDVLSVSHVHRVLLELPECQLINGYGPTENTTFTCCYKITKSSQNGNSIPIGTAIANTQVYILDTYLQPLPIGVPGELYIGGDGLAKGYLNRPQLNSEKFISNPFSNQPGARLYRTGDKVRYLPDGNIEFLGRIDHQVKIRGFRIELGEIEAILTQHPAVEQTVVIVREDVPGDKRLVAYIVTNSPAVPSNRELHRFLRDKLPDYMVPSAFILLDTLPLTPNGKLNRQSLPIPNKSNYQIVTTFVAPRNELELQLVKIWEKLIGVKPIGIKDNFFELGGHSLLAISLWTELEKLIKHKLPLTTLFKFPTIEQLATVIKQQGWSELYSSLVPIQPCGSKPPLFFLNASSYTNKFVSCLGHEQPFYSLSILGLKNLFEKQLSHLRIEDIAKQFIEDMHTIQPNGPYFLVAYCLDTKLAFEMAQQLQAQGQEVALLALIDAVWEPRNLGIYSHLYNFFQFGADYLITKAKGRFKFIKEKLIEYITNIREKFYFRTESALSRHLQAIQLIKAFEQATDNYMPQPYPGKITLFLASELRINNSPTLEELAEKGLEIHEIPGYHLSMFKEPNVKVLTEKLKACLETVQTDNSKTNIKANKGV
ncbi:MAG: amino acid adenylation domain-containing protein [Symploca sp. SIO3C6]|nr:amino acid adenylation domain-containing protein [Symploca sp. SIO3C6]